MINLKLQDVHPVRLYVREILSAVTEVQHAQQMIPHSGVNIYLLHPHLHPAQAQVQVEHFVQAECFFVPAAHRAAVTILTWQYVLQTDQTVVKLLLLV